ncbi:GIY-YIG nuclease superfamily protein [Lacunisphaera limnophila]|uniref:GIY-YIG nuclease superfamily protein n=1 Tax=Lacunisphaera limnophila TaxID=1838286 RepID=A0A1D8AQY0_9BACT|nr:GIY-YIG nuclease family protein [Lacunisphaera limnophila]AOS42974.1 GIY-YIG nuclease superfamily protein [Lacunisphaera limnophila]
MNDFAYVYILESLSAQGGFYVGLTDDLSARLAKHNAGGVPHTAKQRPWRIKTAVAFRDRTKAAAFEKYLKSPSGRAFGKKRL